MPERKSMLRSALVKLEEDEAADILPALSALTDGAIPTDGTVTVMAQPLPFWPEKRFIEIRTIEPAAMRRRFVYGLDGAIALNGQSDTIYALNDNGPFHLNAETSTEYARFFFMTVQDQGEPFQIIDSIDDITWAEDPPPGARQAVGSLIEPLHVRQPRRDGGYDLTACMLYKNGLFRVVLQINGQGRIQVTEETLLLEDLPVPDSLLEV